MLVKYNVYNNTIDEIINDKEKLSTRKHVPQKLFLFTVMIISRHFH